MNPPFRLTIQAELAHRFVPQLRRQLRKAHAVLKPALTELSIILINDRRMSDLHERFMNLAGPTDVLTFPIDSDEQGRVIRGDVAICVPEARRCAREHDVSVADELLLYALHGMLHLAGFDDKTKSDFKLMHRTEDDILARIGVGAVFHRQAKKTARGDH